MQVPSIVSIQFLELSKYKNKDSNLPTTVEMSCLGGVPWKAGVSPPSNGWFFFVAC